MNVWEQLDALAAQHRAATARPKPSRAPIAAKSPRTQIDPVEWLIVFKLQTHVRFPLASGHKRFIHRLTVNSSLSDRGRQYLAYVAYRYRRQWKPNDEEFEWMVRWGVWALPNNKQS